MQSQLYYIQPVMVKQNSETTMQEMCKIWTLSACDYLIQKMENSTFSATNDLSLIIPIC